MQASRFKQTDAQAEKSGNPIYFDLRSLKTNKQTNKQKKPTTTNREPKKWSQICRRIELCMMEIILRFEMNLYNLFFS
jgi:hypothetical protein